MKPILAALALLAAALASAETRYYTVVMKGDRIGYNAIEEGDGNLAGSFAHWTRSHGTGSLSYNGAPIRIEEEDLVWSTPAGRPLRESVTMVALGKRTKIDVAFGTKTAEVDLDAAGNKSHQSLPLPDGTLVYDSIALIRKGMAPNIELSFSSFDVHALAFQKSTLRSAGTAPVDTDGKSTSAVLTELKDEDGTTKIFTSPAGDLLRIEDPNGFVLSAASKAVALAPLGKPSEANDLMVLNAPRSDKPLGELGPGHLLRLRFTGVDFSKIPAERGQIVERDGERWIVQTGAAPFQTCSGAPVVGEAKGQQEWLAPSPYISSDDPKIRALATRLAPKGSVFMYVVPQIRKYVGERMHYQMDFGDTRDARDILRHPKGVCTDYAILTVTLLRAAGIPARIAAGFYTDDGTFFLHAWAEAWDGREWHGVDSTSDSDDLHAGYIKLAQGNVAEALDLSVLKDAKALKIEVLTPVLPARTVSSEKTP